MAHYLAVILFTVFFYLFIPGVGAFIARRRWREFRKRLVQAAGFPLYDFHEFRSGEKNGKTGVFKFFGSLEAIQDQNEVWLRSGNFTVSVDMKDVSIYLVPAFLQTEKIDTVYENNRDIIMDEMPQVLSWNRFHSLSQRTEVMVCGPVFLEKGKAIFRPEPGNSVTFLIYDGRPQSLLRRGVWAGRHRNEFWNVFTPVSLVAGSFALFIYAYYLFSVPSAENATTLALSLSLVPVMPLFPPGVILFFAYRSFWKKGRFLRAERDLLKLPLRFFREEDLSEKNFCTAETGSGIYCFRRLKDRTEAETVCAENGIFIRKPSLSLGDKDNMDFYYFYPDSRGEKDPLAEKIIVEGNPQLLSKECGKKSKFFEYAAVAVFTAGIAMNFFLTFLFIVSVSR